MANVDSAKAKVVGGIGAIQTLVDNFAALFSIDSYKIGDTSFTFMFNILQILGVNESDLIRWVSKILAGKGTDGILISIEYAVKGILLANVKNILTCSMNPLIPDKLMYKYKNIYGKEVGGEGIELDLNAIDLYGVLNNCPTSRDGGVFYFDAAESIYSTDKNIVNGYTPNQLWKSCDFNAYLWFVINKGSNVGEESRKLYWDNRVKYIEKFKQNIGLRESFFTGLSDTIESNNTKIKRKRIILCEYIERSENKTSPNILRVWLNDEQYYHTRKLKLGSNDNAVKLLELNKTLFYFNYDYIFSLKLLEKKTLVANIIHSVLGLSTSVTASYSIQERVVAAKVQSIVKKIIQTDDTEVSDCYYTFDNDEYNKLLEESIKKHKGIYAYNDQNLQFDYSSIIDSINDIDNSATLQEQINNISNVFSQISAIPAQNGSIESKDKFTFGFNIIMEIIDQTITQIVMQVLSPKVAILFQINQYIMGDIDPESQTWNNGWENFLKNFENVIVETIKQIKEIILQQLFAFLIEKLTPLLSLFVSKLLLETINDYVVLLKQLVNMCGLGWFTGSGNKNELAIDNVNYADIVPTQVAPKNDDCG